MPDSDQVNAEKTADADKANEPKADEPNTDKPKVEEPKKDEPKVDVPKVDQPKIEEPKKDEPKIDEPKIDESKVNESRIDKLLAVNRELGIFLEEQLDSVLALRKSVAAIQGFIESDAALKKKYETYLQSAKEDVANPSDLHSASRIRGMLGQLQRTGTV